MGRGAPRLERRLVACFLQCAAPPARASLLPGGRPCAQEMDEWEERYWEEEASRTQQTQGLASLYTNPLYRRQFGARSLRLVLDTLLRSAVLEGSERLAEVVGANCQPRCRCY